MLATIVRTVISRLFFILFLIFCLPFLVVFLLTPRSWLLKSKCFFWCEHIFHWVVLKISWLPITYIGREHIPYEPVIFVVNHQSSFDVPLIGYLMNKKPHIWLALAILRNSLMLRFVLPKVAILVDMSSAASGLRTLRQAITFLSEEPANVIIFPEGGRFTDNTIHPFVSGFALISRKTGRPVVPVLIKGVNKVYPPGSFMVYSHPIVVTVGSVMRVTEQETDDAFKDRVYQWFVTHNQESA